MSCVTKNGSPVPSELPGIHHVTLAGSEQGLRQLSVWEQVLEPGAQTPPHRHDCEEVVLCSAGRGAVLFDGQETHSFEARTTVCIPRNALHQIVNAGNEPLRFIAVFGVSPVQPQFPDGSPIDLPWKS